MPSLTSLVDPTRTIQLANDDWFSQQGVPSGGGVMTAPGAPAPTSTTPPVGTQGGGGIPPRPGTVEEAVAQANQLAYGGANKHNDVNYWREMWAKDPGYTWQRLLGWQAGGADAPVAGPYAGQAAGGGGGGMGAPIGGGAPGELETSPGFKFRLGEGLKALERSAAKRGTLLTGGTAKGLERYAQDYASGEYNNRFNQLYSLSQLGLNAAGQQAATGSQYAGLAGNLLNNQATNTRNLITGQGNAQSAGTIAQGNAWQQGLGGLSNLAQQYYLMRMMTPGSSGGGVTPEQQAYWTMGNVGPVRT